ncbi:hypothetical protein APB85_01565 [Salegentibacter mishustinae]|nr:hypothetical protein APB85_01565 [Salegentibacter mishustinae]
MLQSKSKKQQIAFLKKAQNKYNCFLQKAIMENLLLEFQSKIAKIPLAIQRYLRSNRFRQHSHCTGIEFFTLTVKGQNVWNK